MIQNTGNVDCTVKFYIIGGSTTPVYEKLGINGMTIPAKGKKEFLVSMGTRSVTLDYECPEDWIDAYWKE